MGKGTLDCSHDIKRLQIGLNSVTSAFNGYITRMSKIYNWRRETNKRYNKCAKGPWNACVTLS